MKEGRALPKRSGRLHRLRAAGRLAEIIDPQKHSRTTEYNADGLPEKITDAAGRVSRVEYDLAGRPTAQTDTAGNTTRFHYEGGADVPAGITYPTYQQLFTYDKRGRVIETATLLSADEKLTTRTTYDAAGRKVATTGPAGRTTGYTYDALGRLTAVTDPSDQATTYRYDLRDDLIALTDANGGTHRCGHG